MEIPSLNALFFHNVERFPHERLLMWQRGGESIVWSTAQFVRAVLALRSFLLSSGLERGDRVAILSENRPEWHIADFAILLGGRIVVPVYPTLSAPQIEYLLRHSGARAVVISGRKQWEMLQPLLPLLPQLRSIVSMDADSGAPASLPQILAEAPAQSLDDIRTEALAVDPQATATIVYTSGTTAAPKGVMLSHANIAFNLEQCSRRVGYQKVEQALSVLPLSHVFERLLCYGYFRMGVPIAYGDPYELKALLKRYRPRVLGCVPRMLEKIREAVDGQIAAMPVHRRKIAGALLKASLARARGSNSGTLLAPLAEPLVFRKIRRQLGPVQFVCGGAWLNPELELFYRAAGFSLVQGYGMTETSPVIALNDPENPALGSVGWPLEGVEIRVAEDGELLTRGPHVMQGYHNDPEATRRAFRDGWLVTGDLVRIDENGAVRITGRSKEIFVLSNGKNIVSAVVEQALQRSPYIQRAFAIGESRNYVSAILIPHGLNVLQFAGARSLDEELLTSPEIVSLFQRELETHQSDLARFERAKRFCFLPEEALLDPELVTPSDKMRRRVLESRYAAWIDRMYAREEPLVLPLDAQPAHSSRAHTGVTP